LIEIESVSKNTLTLFGLMIMKLLFTDIIYIDFKFIVMPTTLS